MITLAGSSTVMHEAGTDYTDLGATAFDIVDGNVTDSIEVTGAVDEAMPGEYRWSICKDSASNAAIMVSRLVKVVDGVQPQIALVGEG